MHKSAQTIFSVCLATGFVALSLMFVNSADAQDWAHWRGPEQSGISRETNLVEEWSFEEGKNVAWVAETGGRATPHRS